MTLRQINYIYHVKRIASITLLGLFLFNIAGYYFLFLITDSENRYEMQSHLFQETGLETIRISKSEFKNITFRDEGHEIAINGELYDVKSSSNKGDFIIFYCKKDRKETKLLAGLDNQVKNNTDSTLPNKKQNDTSKKSVKDFLFTKKDITENPLMTVAFRFAIFNFTSYISSPLSPPPPQVSIT